MFPPEEGRYDRPVEETVLVESAGGIATITLNRPERRNALNNATLTHLITALESANANHDIRCIVLTGAGDRAFCSGADLAEVGSQFDSSLFIQFITTSLHLDKPLIGCINGHALAGGFGIALCCDILIASNTATFGTPEIKIGMGAMMVMALMVRHLGRKRTLELFLTGDSIDAHTALQWGIVNRVVPQHSVRSVANEWAARCAEKSRSAIRLGRHALADIDGMNWDEALVYLEDVFNRIRATPDAREGIAAFLEKRTPRFTGE